MYDRTRKILYGNEQIHNGWFSDFNLSDRSKPGSWNHWLRAPSYQKQKKNLSKPTILTATNDINNQKTINGEIRVYIYVEVVLKHLDDRLISEGQNSEIPGDVLVLQSQNHKNPQHNLHQFSTRRYFRYVCSVRKGGRYLSIHGRHI